tara:strand:+ start:298 stop:504 length:207 start_codon:yes stop_codon:yes gene_type:complete
MDWFTLATLLAKALSSVLGLLERKQLMDAGEARLALKASRTMLKRLEKVKRARRDESRRKRVRDRNTY